MELKDKSKKHPLDFSEFQPVSTTEWEKLILKDLNGQDYDKKLIWHLQDGIKIKPYYRQEDLEKLEYLKTYPGKYPFIRGCSNENNWKIRQDINVENISSANETALQLIHHGADAICFNISQVPPVSELNKLLYGINPEITSVSFARSDCFRDLITFFIEYLNHKKYPLDKIQGGLDVDPFANLLINGEFADSIDAVKSRLNSIHSLVSENLPDYKSINIRGHIYHNSGATAAQELAFSLAAANEYLSLLSENNSDIDTILNRFQFTFAIGSDYFVEIAKLRAARLLWSYIGSEYKPKSESSTKMIITSVTSYWNKSIIDPYTNMLRLTTEAISAITGGCHSLIVQPFDFLQKKQNEFSLINAIHIQNLLKEESGFDKVVDPSAGSYYIENLTDLIAEKAWDIFRMIEKSGGFIESAKKGIIQSEIGRVAEIKNMDVIARKEKILGVNIFPDIHEKILDEIEIDTTAGPLPKDKMVKPLEIHRKAIAFEKIRLRTEKFVRNGGKLPQVFLFPVGNPAMSSARNMFSRNFFGCSGFNIIENDHFADADEGVEAMKLKKPDIVVVCSADNEYLEWTAKIICKAKNERLSPIIIVAGFPEKYIEELKSQGVNDFIHIKSNIIEVIEKYQDKFGINQTLSQRS